MRRVGMRGLYIGGGAPILCAQTCKAVCVSGFEFRGCGFIKNGILWERGVHCAHVLAQLPCKLCDGFG
jgi:hypothetical protein